MKKICAVFALFCAMILLVGCDNGSNNDADNVDPISETSDSDDSGNTNSDDADSQSDTTADTATDEGNSGNDSDSGDTDTTADDQDSSDSGNDSGDLQPDDDSDTSSDEDSQPTTRVTECTGLPENAVWNSVSNITQTWDGSDWIPTNSAIFSETPSTSKCFFKCAENYEWNNSTCVECASIGGTWNSSSFPECSASSGTPCKDSSTGYIWSAKTSTTYTWQNAVDYCNSYSEGGLSGWHLPTITELRTLILDCPSTMPTGSCAVNDPGCLSSSCWTSATCVSCSQDSSGGHSKFGETGYFWSSSTLSDDTDGAWSVDFSYGDVLPSLKTNIYNVRCVARTREANCTGLPTNAVWNSVSNITQTWDGSEWIPSNIGSYNTAASSSECRFKCNEHYNWENSSSSCKAETKTANCTGLPTNAVWNSVSNITQTWDGSDWIPTNSAIFSETPSTSKCFFKCAENYEWNNSTCVDPAAEECASIGGTWNSSSSKCTRTQNCSSKPADTVWNTVSSITQTYNYDDETWEPSTTSSFNETGSTSQCRYKCATNYEWNGSSCVASIPECSSTSSTPCKDSSTGYIWSAKASTTYTWQDAVDYCNSYSEGGLSGWHLPTITELRTLILNCPSTMPTGSCAVNDPGCLSSSCWTSATCVSCSQDSSGGHSKFGETGYFWSSSTLSDDTDGAWSVDFSYGDVLPSLKTNIYNVRCVR